MGASEKSSRPGCCSVKSLAENLTACGMPPVVLGGKLLVSPFGGRCLALAPDGTNNVLWTNPAFAAVASAKALLTAPGWANLGGDRTWISPEIDTLVADPAHMMEGYAVPKAMDPGAYEVLGRDDRSVTLESRMEIRFRRSGAVLDLKVTKTIELIDVPPLDRAAGVEFAGYRQRAVLSVAASPGAASRPGLWHLLQVPGGGSIVIPVREGARPRPFIGSPVYGVEGGRINCEVAAEAGFKFGILAGDSVGLMLSLNRTGPRDLLVARRFPVHAAEHYSDVPCADPDDLGYVQQIYVDDGALGGFGEMEYHGAAADASAGGDAGDLSEVWAFSGTGLSELAETILERFSTPLPVNT